MGLREEKKRETRAAIVETALELFRAQGFAHTRIQDVAARLRISEATFFNYFPTKQSVLEAVADQLVEQSVEQLRHDAPGEGEAVPARIESLVEELARSFEGDREFSRLLAAHTTFFSAASHGRLAHARTWLTDLLVEGQSRGEIRDDIAAAQLADVFMAATLAMVYAWVFDLDAADSLEQRLVAAASVVMSGCRTR